MAGAWDQGYMELVLMTTPSNTSSFGNGNGNGDGSERLRSSLAQCSLFTGLPPAGVDDLIRRMTQRSSSARSAVVSQGEPGAGLFIVVSGRVKLAVLGDNGREITLHLLRTGEVFGEVSLLDRSPSTATAIAIGDASVACISREALFEHMQAYPLTMLNLVEEMARRQRRAEEAIAGLALHDVEERLRRLLTRLAREEGEVGPDGILLRRGPTQQDLASMVGSSRETVSRTFTALIRGGLMLRRGRALIITQRMLNRRGPSTPAPAQMVA